MTGRGPCRTTMTRLGTDGDDQGDQGEHDRNQPGHSLHTARCSAAPGLPLRSPGPPQPARCYPSGVAVGSAAVAPPTDLEGQAPVRPRRGPEAASAAEHHGTALTTGTRASRRPSTSSSSKTRALSFDERPCTGRPIATRAVKRVKVKADSRQARVAAEDVYVREDLRRIGVVSTILVASSWWPGSSSSSWTSSTSTAPGPSAGPVRNQPHSQHDDGPDGGPHEAGDGQLQPVTGDRLKSSPPTSGADDPSHEQSDGSVSLALADDEVRDDSPRRAG